MYQLQLSIQEGSSETGVSEGPEFNSPADSGFSGDSIDLNAARGNLRRILEEDGSDVVVEIPAARVLDLVEECAFWKNRTHEMGEIARRLEKILDRNLEMLKR